MTCHWPITIACWHTPAPWLLMLMGRDLGGASLLASLVFVVVHAVRFHIIPTPRQTPPVTHWKVVWPVHQPVTFNVRDIDTSVRCLTKLLPLSILLLILHPVLSRTDLGRNVSPGTFTVLRIHKKFFKTLFFTLRRL